MDAVGVRARLGPVRMGWFARRGWAAAARTDGPPNNMPDPLLQPRESPTRTTAAMASPFGSHGATTWPLSSVGCCRTSASGRKAGTRAAGPATPLTGSTTTLAMRQATSGARRRVISGATNDPSVRGRLLGIACNASPVRLGQRVVFSLSLWESRCVPIRLSSVHANLELRYKPVRNDSICSFHFLLSGGAP